MKNTVRRNGRQDGGNADLHATWLSEAYARPAIEWWRYRDWADELKIKAPRKSVLQAICKMVDRNGVTPAPRSKPNDPQPAYRARLALVSGATEVTVKRCIQRLVEDGLIRIVATRDGQRNGPNRYIAKGPNGFVRGSERPIEETDTRINPVNGSLVTGDQRPGIHPKTESDSEPPLDDDWLAGLDDIPPRSVRVIDEDEPPALAEVDALPDELRGASFNGDDLCSKQCAYGRFLTPGVRCTRCGFMR